jgi:hypothetical protein
MPYILARYHADSPRLVDDTRPSAVRTGAEMAESNPGGGTRPEAEVRQVRDDVIEQLHGHPEPRLQGILAAIEWTLGRRESAPVTGATEPPSSGSQLAHEQHRAHQASEHPRLSGMAPEYITAVQQTLLWLEGKSEVRPITRDA